MTIAGKVIRTIGKILKVLVGVGAAAAATETAIETAKPSVEEIIKMVIEIQRQINALKENTIEVTKQVETPAGVETMTMQAIPTESQEIISALEKKKKKYIKKLEDTTNK